MAIVRADHLDLVDVDDRRWAYQRVPSSPIVWGDRPLKPVQLAELAAFATFVSTPDVRARLEAEQILPVFLDLLTGTVDGLIAEGVTSDRVPVALPAALVGITNAVFDHLDAWPHPYAQRRTAVVTTFAIWGSDRRRESLFRQYVEKPFVRNS